MPISSRAKVKWQVSQAQKNMSIVLGHLNVLLDQGYGISDDLIVQVQPVAEAGLLFLELLDKLEKNV